MINLRGFPGMRARAIAGWGLLALGIAGAIVWRVGNIRDSLSDEVNTSYTVTTRGLLIRVVDWARARGSHAEAMAALLANDIASGDADGDGLQDRFANAMRVLASENMFVGGRIVGPSGAVLAAVSPPGVLDSAFSSERVPPSTLSLRAVPPPSANALDAMTSTLETSTVACGRAFCIEFSVPVRHQSRHVGSLVLIASVDDSTFQSLNPSRAGMRTTRTSVLAPMGSGGSESDTFVVLASVGDAESPEPTAVQLRAALPPSIRRVMANEPGDVVADTGPGLHGRTVHYAVARVPGLDWAVLREFDRAELLGIAQKGMLIEEPILVALVLSIVVLVRTGLRTGRARRDRELTRLRADFVASTSHELLTPLAQIRMFAELLQKNALRGPEEVARALRIIEKEASRLTILVENVLNYSRLRRRADDARIDAPSSTNVADDVRQVIEAFAPLAAERGARVVSDVAEELYAHVDSLALRQVLINFLENAVKYGPTGQTVEVGAAEDHDMVRLWVDDEGPGVPVEERNAVWTAFRRGARAEASALGGSGIGLAVVRELVMQSRGSVSLEESPRGGARFIAAFPRADRAVGRAPA